jgi:hypothetical protein
MVSQCRSSSLQSMESAGNTLSLLDSARKGVKVGAPRQAAYDNCQCNVIVRAMIATKNDSIRGSSQKREDFHARFKQKYDVMKRSTFPPRSICSLTNKFAEIRHDCSQFRGILSKIQSAVKPSGSTTNDEEDIRKVRFPSHQITCVNLKLTLYEGS